MTSLSASSAVKSMHEKSCATSRSFLGEQLNLEVSPDKSGVRDASKGTPFLGYHVCAFTLRSAGSMASRNRSGGKAITGAPSSNTREASSYGCRRTGSIGFAERRNSAISIEGMGGYALNSWILARRKLSLPTTPSSGDLANYYAIADGVKSSLNALELVMWRSLLATIAAMRRTSVPQIKRKLKMGTDFGVTTMVRGKPRVQTFWRLKNLKVTAWPHPAVDVITVGSRLAQSPNDFSTRLRASLCEFLRRDRGAI